MRELLRETEVATLVFVCHYFLGAKFYFACNAESKRGAHCMIKCINFYDISKEKLVTRELDSHTCIGANQKIAEAIDTRMRKPNPYNHVVANHVIHRLSTDTCSSGTGDRLARYLRVLSRFSPI